jgi:Restriction endonuclease
MEAPRLYDPARAETRVAFGVAEAEFAASTIARATAEQMRAIVAVLAEARREPAALLDEASVDMLDVAQQVDYAQRAAVADLAASIGMAEGTVWALARQGQLLMQATPRVWARFREGEFSAPNARRLADRVTEVSPERWYDLDAAVEQLGTLAPARFASWLNRIVEQLATEPLAVRHRRAEERRCVTVEPERDGMAWLGIHLSAANAAQVMSRLDADADHLASLPDETRTRDQLRADVAVALLLSTSATGSPVRATVSVTVPVLTLLGLSDEPGSLDGCTPIDPGTARELAASAPSFHRILTHPITGAILDVDRTTYQVPADLKRAVIARNPTCVFPGCGRHARRCDLDHTHAWADGGPTCLSNLRPLCTHHHRLKHLTTWRVTPTPTGVEWESPTGRIHHIDDPPPFCARPPF